MPVEKVSLSLDAQIVAEARAASGGNLSAYVNEALEARVRNRQLRQVLDDFKDEFEPLGPEEDERIVREFDEAVAKAEAGRLEVERILVDGTEALDEHPLVEEAVIARGPLYFPIGYVVLADESQSVTSVVSELGDYLRRRLTTRREIRFVIVPKDPSGRPPLPGVVPL